LQFRSLKLYRGAAPNQDVFQIITDNVRFAESCLGDLRAQIAACRIGERGLGALVRRYGLKTFRACVKTIWHQSEALAREQVALIKPGEYEAEALFDSDGVNLDRPVPLKVKVAVDGSEMTIDFSKISEQVPGSINSGASGAVAAARVAFKSLVAIWADTRVLVLTLGPEEDFSVRQSWVVVGAGGHTKTARTPPYRCARATCKTRRSNCRKFIIPC
jgi:N-methylhydantoinase B